MKNVILSSALVFSALNASALICSTNVNNDPRGASTSVSVKVRGAKADISIVTFGGMAHFVTAPEKFVADVSHVGPEIVKYENESKGFELTVDAQPLNGEISGTLTETSEGKADNFPVLCKLN